ncbi:BamA/OMP85 family outer membrane protein [Congregicoccus parvus]|uniref:BamA/OMP85 family outer membrane protein n=1 Tax=Congregicoccus parvus TaxID=3081749 RepID=UPI003FA55F21
MRALFSIVGVLMLVPWGTRSASAEEASGAQSAVDVGEARVRVSGLGWWADRRARETLRLLDLEGVERSSIDGVYLEDAIVLLQSVMEREGYLRARGRVVLRKGGEVLWETGWETGEVPPAPAGLAGDEALFRLEPGVRFRFGELAFEGLTAIPESEARKYFVEETLLLESASGRRFTPARLTQGARNLQERLVRLGYADARVEAARRGSGEATEVDVDVFVREGARHRVGRTEIEGDLSSEMAEAITTLCERREGRPWSRMRQQDFLQEVRAVGYAAGYPDMDARLQLSDTVDDGEERVVRQRLLVDTGGKVTVGEVRFEGADDVKERVLRRAVSVASGDDFVRARFDEDRLRLSALGVFSSVRTEVEPGGQAVRDVTYRTSPGKRLELGLLAGYGSYEQLRAGVELQQWNLFGRAHRARFQGVYSMRSISGNYVYAIPQVFGTTTDASLQIYGLQREEVSFDREDLGASVGLRRFVRALGADVAVRYQFESVEADITDPTARVEVPTDSRVASVTLDLTRDRRDNPLQPRRGSHLSATLELASEAIGGSAEYQLLDLRGSWHRRIGSGRWLHVGARHGLVSALGASREGIPFSKRFFPGGENTVRGFREGRASPRNEDGLIVGAEVSTVINVEVEQALTRSFSVVGFVDAGLTGETLSSWPGRDWRVSAGVGLRYNTIIGPARLEYGHNIAKRPGDPIGALHFALGFPF